MMYNINGIIITGKEVRTLLEKIINMVCSDEGNALRYRIIYAFCFLIHLFYAFQFWGAGIVELFYFNIASTAMYLLGIVLVRNNRFTLLWIFLIYAEIISHGFMCSMYIGYESQMSLFSFAVIPVAYFITYIDPCIRKPLIISSGLAFVNIILLIGSSDLSRGREPIYNNLDHDFITHISRLNIIFAVIILISFSIMFIGKINYDLTKLKIQNEKLDRLAYYDQLTGLRNRNHIRDIFKEYINSTEPYCVILGDIDDFKHVNDTYGHSAGDEVLKTVSSIIQNDVGTSGVVCRWGGEEILILVKGTTDKCIALNEKILKEIRNTTVESGNSRIRVTMTFGLCDYGDAMNIEKLISLADKRLYIGKKNGKNQVVTAS